MAVKVVIRMAQFKFTIIRKENYMNLGMIFVLIAVTLHTIGTLIINEETSKQLRNVAFGFYGVIMILIIGGVIK